MTDQPAATEVFVPLPDPAAPASAIGVRLALATHLAAGMCAAPGEQSPAAIVDLAFDLAERLMIEEAARRVEAQMAAGQPDSP